MPTTKQICKAVEKETGHKVGLNKVDGIWYWYDADEVPYDKCICIRFNEACTHLNKLNDLTIDEWLEDFKIRVEEAQH